MNVVNYREDEETFLAMIRSVLDGDKAMVRLGTGYLNLQREVFNELMKTKHAVHLLTSSPKANGFYKGGLVKKYIPGIYRVNEM